MVDSLYVNSRLYVVVAVDDVIVFSLLLSQSRLEVNKLLRDNHESLEFRHLVALNTLDLRQTLDFHYECDFSLMK